MKNYLYYLINEGNQDSIYPFFKNDIPLDKFIEICSLDPTSKVENNFVKYVGNYSKWLLNLYKNKKLKDEDFYKAKDYLTIFDKRKSKLEVRDINKYKSLQDVYAVLDSNNLFEIKTDREKRRDIHKGKDDIILLYENDKWKFLLPQTKEASCYWGSDTQWCTATRTENNVFDQYNDFGNLYILINKNTKEKYQFHIQSSSYMDSSDHPISKATFNKIFDSDAGLKDVFIKKIIGPRLDFIFYQNNNKYTSDIGTFKYSYHDKIITISATLEDIKFYIFKTNRALIKNTDYEIDWLYNSTDNYEDFYVDMMENLDILSILKNDLSTNNKIAKIIKNNYGLDLNNLEDYKKDRNAIDIIRDIYIDATYQGIIKIFNFYCNKYILANGWKKEPDNKYYYTIDIEPMLYRLCNNIIGEEDWLEDQDALYFNDLFFPHDSISTLKDGGPSGFYIPMGSLEGAFDEAYFIKKLKEGKL